MAPIQYFLPVILVATMIGLSGCEQPESDVEVQSIRPIKTITLASQVEAVSHRSFPGIVHATNSSALSFEVSGKVLRIEVNVGDHVTAGQLLAFVDDEPFKLEVQSAQAELGKAKANRDKSVSEYSRKKEMRTKGFISASDLDQALAERDANRNQVTIARSRLDIAKRELRNTRLKAPFSGYISKRLVEPHQEIASGHELFQLDALEVLEVELMLPENI
ncbi:MAG: efflux RND transporter periplasmic adaptor subunit, partial [Candidatus Thiodiazotropha lotti]